MQIPSVQGIVNMSCNQKRATAFVVGAAVALSPTLRTLVPKAGPEVHYALGGALIGPLCTAMDFSRSYAEEVAISAAMGIAGGCVGPAIFAPVARLVGY